MNMTLHLKNFFVPIFVLVGIVFFSATAHAAQVGDIDTTSGGGEPGDYINPDPRDDGYDPGTTPITETYEQAQGAADHMSEALGNDYTVGAVINSETGELIGYTPVLDSGTGAPADDDGGCPYTAAMCDDDDDSETTCTGTRAHLDLDARDIYFVDELGATVDQNRLIVGPIYSPVMRIRNVSCVGTDAVFADNGHVGTPGAYFNAQYFNGNPFGTDGRFQVRMDLGLPDNGYDIRYNNFGPLPRSFSTDRYPAIISETRNIPSNTTGDANSLFYSFPSVKFGNEDVGTHTFTASLDTNCNNPNGWGCIFEGSSDYRDSYSESFTVVRPTLSLGTFLVNGNNVSDVSINPEREITDSTNYGLYWEGSLIDFSTCVGTSENNFGDIFTDFDGQGDIAGISSGLRANLPRAEDRVDINLGDVFDGRYRIYEIRCNIQGTRSYLYDSVVISNNTIVEPPVGDVAALGPRVEDILVPPAQTGVNIDFTIENDAPSSVDNYETRILIEGVEESGWQNHTNSIPAAGFADHTQTASSWTSPNTETRVPYSVCVRHEDMNGGERCSGAYLVITDSVSPPATTQCNDTIDNDGDLLIDANDPGCWTNTDDPLTYDPTDDDETNTTATNPECSDGIDNNDPEDTIADYPNDPGCTSPADDSELDNSTVTQCNDGIDNSDPEDTLADRNDPGCWSNPTNPNTYDPSDNNETNGAPSDPQCSDGGHNDSDGLIDYPNDPGCTGPDDDDEYNPPTQCSDNVDNNDPEDTLVDMNDPDCTSPADDDESNPNYPTCVDFSVSPNPSLAGNPVTFTWQTTNAVSVSIDNGVGSGLSPNNVSGRNFTPSAIGNVTYTLTMTGATGITRSCPTDITLTTTANPNIDASPTVIRQGDDVDVWWNPGGGTNCTLNPVSLFSGTPPANANGVRNESDPYVITPSGSTAVIYDCNGVEDRVDIRVIPVMFET